MSTTIEDINWIVDFAMFLSTSSVIIWMPEADDSKMLWSLLLRSKLESQSVSMGVRGLNDSFGDRIAAHSSLNFLFKNQLPQSLNTRTPWLIENSANWNENLILRLDSQVYVYSVSESKNEVLIEEVFAYRNRLLQKNVIFIWDRRKSKASFRNREQMWKRRSDLLGASLVNTIKPRKGISAFVYDKSRNIIGTNGKFQAILGLLADRCNFTFKSIPSVDGQWGALVNGSWNGMVGMLVKGTADVISAYLTFSIGRNEVIDFTVPLEEETAAIALKKSDFSNTKLLGLRRYFFMDRLVNSILRRFIHSGADGDLRSEEEQQLSRGGFRIVRHFERFFRRRHNAPPT